MIAIYLRISTDEQSTEMQRTDILQQVSHAPHVIYEDRGISGTTSSRPGLNKLKEDIAKGLITELYVWKIDRLFRSLQELIGAIAFFEAHKVKFVSIKDHIDLSTPAGRLLVHMMGAFAEFEVALIRERVRAGMKNAKDNGTRSGKPIGRPSENDVDAVVALRKQNKSYGEIQAMLGISKGKVARALKKAV